MPNTIHLLWNPNRGVPDLFVEALLRLELPRGQVKGLDRTLPEFMRSRRKADG